MPKYEVSVSAFQHVTVEADTEEEAKEKAESEAEEDLPYGWTISESHADRTLL